MQKDEVPPSRLSHKARLAAKRAARAAKRGAASDDEDVAPKAAGMYHILLPQFGTPVSWLQRHVLVANLLVASKALTSERSAPYFAEMRTCFPQVSTWMSVTAVLLRSSRHQSLPWTPQIPGLPPVRAHRRFCVRLPGGAIAKAAKAPLPLRSRCKQVGSRHQPKFAGWDTVAPPACLPLKAWCCAEHTSGGELKALVASLKRRGGTQEVKQGTHAKKHNKRMQ